MRTAWPNAALSLLVFAFPSCTPLTPEEQFVRQKIPVELQNRKPLTVEIHDLSGNGVNDVGIRCTPEIWTVLTNGTETVTVRLLSSNKSDTEIGGVDPKSGATGFFGYLTNVHYLFYIGGRSGARALVELTFPNAPGETTRAEIIVGKTPADTGL